MEAAGITNATGALFVNCFVPLCYDKCKENRKSTSERKSDTKSDTVGGIRTRFTSYLVLVKNADRATVPIHPRTLIRVGQCRSASAGHSHSCIHFITGSLDASQAAGFQLLKQLATFEGMAFATNGVFLSSFV